MLSGLSPQNRSPTSVEANAMSPADATEAAASSSQAPPVAQTQLSSVAPGAVAPVQEALVPAGESNIARVEAVEVVVLVQNPAHPQGQPPANEQARLSAQLSNVLERIQQLQHKVNQQEELRARRTRMEEVGKNLPVLPTTSQFSDSAAAASLHQAAEVRRNASPAAAEPSLVA